MTDILSRLTASLAEKYEIQKELGAGAMGMNIEIEVSTATSIFLVQYSIFDIRLAHPFLAVKD